MPEQAPTTGTVAAGTADTLIATTVQVGNQGAVNVDNPLAPGVIPLVVVRFSYFFTWGATTTTLTLRCRRGGLTGTQVNGSPARQGPAAATPDFVHWEWIDTNVPNGTVYAISAQAAGLAVTGGFFSATVNDFT